MQAAADLRTLQYRILRASAAGECNVASNPGGGADDLIGVLQNKPNSGQHASVGYIGITKCIASATVAANRMVSTNSNGGAIHAASGDWAVGMALTAGEDGEFITMQLLSPARHISSSLAAL